MLKHVLDFLECHDHAREKANQYIRIQIEILVHPLKARMSLIPSVIRLEKGTPNRKKGLVKATCNTCKAVLVGSKEDVMKRAKGHAMVHRSFVSDGIMEELMDPDEYYGDPFEFEGD